MIEVYVNTNYLQCVYLQLVLPDNNYNITFNNLKCHVDK